MLNGLNLDSLQKVTDEIRDRYAGHLFVAMFENDLAVAARVFYEAVGYAYAAGVEDEAREWEHDLRLEGFDDAFAD